VNWRDIGGREGCEIKRIMRRGVGRMSMVTGEWEPGKGRARGTSRDGGKNKGSGNGEGVEKVARVRERRERGNVNSEERLTVPHKIEIA
jgi:hypothetical protein